MSESVWFEQVDIAFKKLLQRVIQIDGKPVKVVIRKPDEDFNTEDYPLVSIYNLYDRFSKIRYSSEPIVVSNNKEDNSLVLEDPAIPFDLFYQIDFWSTLQTDMNSITRQWKSFSKSWFNLDVSDMSGIARSCFVLSRNDFNKSDLMQNGRRLFHSFGTYKVQVELDEKVQNVVPMAIYTPDVKVNEESDGD